MIHDTLAKLSVPIEGLKPYHRNPRQGDIGAIIQSLEHHGQYRPIVVNSRTQEVLAGNHTLEAARQLGWTDIAATFVDVDEDQAARIVLIDNRANDLATYDADALTSLLQELAADEGGLTGTGFDGDDLDDMLTELGALQGPAAGAGSDPGPQEPPKKPRTKTGDLWLLGDHRLLCGDATDIASVDRLRDGAEFDMVFTDPPYGVNVSGKGGASISGDLGNVAITGFFQAAVDALKIGRPIYLCGGGSNVPLYFKLYELHCRQLPSMIVWDKGHFVLRRHDYHAQYELIYYGWKPGGRPEDRWYGDHKQADIWQIKRDPPGSYEHPTQKPVALPERAMLNSSEKGGIVYEPFGGSGSTLIAAELTGRVAYCMEIDPAFCDVIVDRWERTTGLTATLEGPQ